MNHYWRGVAYVLAAAILFGVSIPLTKLMLGRVDPWLMAGFLDLGAGAGLAGLQLGRKLSGVPGSEAALRRGDWPWMLAAIVAGGVLGPLLFVLGLARIDAASASLLVNLEGLAAMAIAWIVFREKADRRIVVGGLAIVAGALALSWPGQGVALNTGAIIIAGACLAWAIDSNIIRKIAASDPHQITIVRGLAAGAIILGLAMARGASLPPAEFVAAALALGFVGYGICWVFIVLGLRHLGTARMAAYFSTGPFIGAAIAVGFLGEPVTLPLIVGGLLMAAGIWIHATEKRPPEPSREPAVHQHRQGHGGPRGHGHAPAPVVQRRAHSPDVHRRGRG